MADKNSINLGRVLPIYKGDWSADTNYDILDIVYYNGNSYTAKQPSTNQEPKADSAYWGLSSVKGQKGDQGPKGDRGATGPAGKDADIPVIGGRNLLLDTGRSFTGIGTNSINGAFGYHNLAGGKKESDLYKQYGSSGYLTLSFDWVASGSTISGEFVPVWGDTPWGGLSNGPIKVSANNNLGHYKYTVRLNASGYSSGVAHSVAFRQDKLQGNVTISNLKLEAGNVATDWTPAPEDVDSAISNVQTTADNASTNVTNLKQKVNVLGQANLLINTEFSPDFEGWRLDTSAPSSKLPFQSYAISGSESITVGFDTSQSPTKSTTRLLQIVPLPNTTGRALSLRWKVLTLQNDNYDNVRLLYRDADNVDISDVYTSWADTSKDGTWHDKTWENLTIPDNAVTAVLYFQAREGTKAYLKQPMLAFGSSIGAYVKGPYYPKDDIQALKDHAILDTGNQTIAGNKIIVGDNTYMGTNTFMDGLSLVGKNVVNGLTDTDWLDIPLAEGRTGTAKYKVSLGKVFVHIDRVKGITGTGLTDQGTICSLPVNPSPFYTRYIIQSFNSPSISLKQVTISPNGDIYVSNDLGNAMSESDQYILDIVIM